jgi:hypothetical protein
MKAPEFLNTLILHHYWGINTTIGVLPLSYVWSWGGICYDVPGTYPVSLTITGFPNPDTLILNEIIVVHENLL